MMPSGRGARITAASGPFTRPRSVPTIIRSPARPVVPEEDPLSSNPSPGSPRQPGRFVALYPILLAAYPVLFLWSQNVGETQPNDVVGPIVIAMAVAALLTWLAGRLLGDRRRGALVVAPIVVGALMYGHVANLARPLHVPGLVQQAAWVALTGFAFVAAIRLPVPKLAALDVFLTRVTTVLIVVTLVLIVPFQVGNLLDRSTVAADAQVQTDTSAQKRDVYYLVWDRYGSDRSFELRTGLKNDLTPWLQDHGFTTLPDSHANYVRTTISLATTLNMEHLDQLITPLNPDSRSFRPLDDLLLGPTVPRQFQALGYRYIHIGSWYDATDVDPSADVNYNWEGTSDFLEQLYAASAGPALTKRLHLASVVPTHSEEHYEHAAFGLEKLDDMVDEPGPKFVFGHVLLPHPPYVFDTRRQPVHERRDRDAVPARTMGTPARVHERPDPIAGRGAPGPPPGAAADHHPAGGRGPLPRRLRGDAGRLRLVDRDRRRARGEVRDHERVVSARRRGRPRPLSVDDEHQHVHDPVRRVLRPRLRAAARHDLHLDELAAALWPDRRHRAHADPALRPRPSRLDDRRAYRRRSRKSTLGLSSIASSATVSQRAPVAARKPSSV